MTHATLPQQDRLTYRDTLDMLEDSVRDRTYVTNTSLGRHVDDFLRSFAGEYGARPESVRSYEYTLARLALYQGQLPLEALEPPRGTDMIRDFWLRRWPPDEAMPHTRVCKLAHMKTFCRWCVEERRLIADPARAIRYPKGRGRERRAHPPAVITALALSQYDPEDMIAVELMGRQALRRDELRRVQRRHIDLYSGLLTVFGKGGTVKPIPLFPDLLERVLRLALERQWQPDEFLIYPRKTGMKNGRMQTIWEDRSRSLSLSGMDKWWKRCLARAGVDPFPMHELRHSAGTNFYRATRDLKLTQMLMRHEHAKTTADVYLHMDTADLAAAMREMGAE